MDIPVGQQSVIYNGEVYNQELTEVAELITSPEAIKIIWQSLSDENYLSVDLSYARSR